MGGVCCVMCGTLHVVCVYVVCCVRFVCIECALSVWCVLVVCWVCIKCVLSVCCWWCVYVCVLRVW